VDSRTSLARSSASRREAIPAIRNRNAGSPAEGRGTGERRRGSSRTRGTLSATKVFATSVAFIKRPVVETVAERTSVASATRMVGSCLVRSRRSIETILSEAGAFQSEFGAGVDVG
jgi:hypothetical protein